VANMEKPKEEWNVMAIGASLNGGTVFEFKKKSNSKQKRRK